jgi:glycosyltransferase involved in cell wall biosynthesis
LGEARNTGIRNSTGMFAAFIDSDDWIEEQMIELLVNSAMRSNADITCCGFNKVRMNKSYPYFINTELNNENDFIALCLNEVHNSKKKVVTTVWAKLFKLSLLKDNAILFSLRSFEDSPFFLKAVYYSNRISFVREPLYNYSLRDDSISNSPISESKLNCFYQADNIILNFLKEKGLYDTYRKRFESFHLLRIVLYGGCRALYWRGQGSKNTDNYLVFIKYLKSQRSFFKQFKPNDDFEMKVLRILRIGLFLERINYKLPNLFFRSVCKFLNVNG